MRCCFTVILCVQLITTVFSKLLRRQHFLTHCSNCCLIQEQSFRADKLMEFYKVSSYIGVFIVPLYTKYCQFAMYQYANHSISKFNGYIIGSELWYSVWCYLLIYIFVIDIVCFLAVRHETEEVFAYNWELSSVSSYLW